LLLLDDCGLEVAFHDIDPAAGSPQPGEAGRDGQISSLRFRFDTSRTLKKLMKTH
jgi:hypothetical protein